jgi:DNA polymerase I
VTENNHVKLEFLDERGEYREIVDDQYRPYFFVDLPLKKQEEKTVELFSGTILPVEKIDLFSSVSRKFGKVIWPNSKLAARASEKISNNWESEVEFNKSYVYDRGLAFCAYHFLGDLRLSLEMPYEVESRFRSTFKTIQTSDPAKYEQIRYWYTLLSQPIPEFEKGFFGKAVEPSEIYRAFMLARIANIPLREAFSSRHVSDWIKGIIYAYLRKNNTLIPSSEELRRGKETRAVPGALTIAPKAGAYFNTVVCDFESLYASCIDSFNLSYETVDCGHVDCRDNRIPEVDYSFCVKRRGFYSILVGALKDLRIKVFKPMSRDSSLPEKDREIAAVAAKLLKLILVSSYGVTVRIHGVACRPLAEAITGCGRHVLGESWKLAEENGLRPVYGDTDSLFLDNASDVQVEWLINSVRNRFRMDLAVDKQYNLCVLPKAKKAYFGILSDGTSDIKGVTAIKSNSPKYIRNVFECCVKEFSTARNLPEYSEGKERIKSIVKKAVLDLKNRHVKLEDLIYSVQLYFDPNEKLSGRKTIFQPYQCAKQLIDAGKRLKKGDTVSFAKVRPFRYGKKIFTVKPIELVKNVSEINTIDYVRNLLTALNQTFSSMGIRLEEEKETEISRWFKD